MKAFLGFLFLIISVQLSAQIPADSVALGLRPINLTIRHDNYTGFDAGGSANIDQALQYLYAKLSAHSQEHFKAYELGLYRLFADNTQKVKRDNNAYTEYAGSQSTYYLIVTAAWKNQQEIDDFPVFFNLPTSEIPAYAYYTNDEIAEIGKNFIREEFEKVDENVNRLREIQANGIRKFADFLFTEIEEEIFIPSDNHDDNPLATAPNTANRLDPCTDAVTYVLATGELIALPKTAITYFLTCSEPKGALYKFILDGSMYFTWYTKDFGEEKFAEIATMLPNSNPPKPGIKYIPTCPTDKDHIYVFYSVGEIIRANWVSMPNAIPYVTGSKLHHKHSLFDLFANPIVIEPQVTRQNPCPVAYNPINSVKNTNLPTGTAGEPPYNQTYSQEPSCVMLQQIYDYTGRFSHIKNLVINDQAPGAQMDIIITDENTPLEKMQAIAQIQPQCRAILWVKLDHNTNFFYSEVKLPVWVENQTGSEFGRIRATFWEIGHGLAQSIDKDNALLSYLSLNRYLYGLLGDILNGVKIPERYWNEFHPDYFLTGDLHQFIKDHFPGIIFTISLVSGLEHSLIDNLVLVANLTSLPTQIFSLIVDPEFREGVSEQFSSIIEAIPPGPKRDYLWNIMTGKLSAEWDDIVVKKNLSKEYFFVGYAIMEMTVAIITEGTLTSLKVAVTSSRAFVYACEIIDRVVATVRYSVPYLDFLVYIAKGNYLVLRGIGAEAGQYIVKVVKATGEQFLAKLDEHGRVILQSIDEILELVPEYYPGVAVNAITPDGVVHVLYMKETGEGFYKAGSMAIDLLQELKNKLLKPDFGGDLSDLRKIVKDAIGPDALLDNNLATAIRTLDGNSLIDFTNRNLFIEDLRNTITTPNGDGIGQALRGLTPDMVEAWKILKDAGRDNLRKRFSMLQKLGALKNNTLGYTAEDFKKMFIKHRTYGIGGDEVLGEDGLPNIISNYTLSGPHLLDAMAYLNQHAIPGANDVLRQLCCSSGKFYIGGEYQLRLASQDWGNIKAFEQAIVDGQGNVIRRTDILRKTSNPNFDLINECKSWKRFEVSYYIRTIKEFVEDLKYVQDLKYLRWSFDAKGLILNNDVGRQYLHSSFITMLETTEGRAALRGIPPAQAAQILKNQALTTATPGQIEEAVLEYFRNTTNFEKVVQIQ